MESSQVFLNKVMLNIATSKDQGLNLVKGEVLRGVVQEVKADGVISLLIKGQVIDAVSEVPVKPGQQLQLMVEDFRDGKTYLKALTPELLEKIENTNLTMNLKDIGVAAKESNIQMAKKLLAHNLPVTTSNLNELSKGMKLIGGANARNMEIAAFAMQRGIPLTQQSLNSLAQFTAPGNALPQLVKDILQTLASLSQLPAGSQAATSSQDAGEAAATRNPTAGQEPLPADKTQIQSGNSSPKHTSEATGFLGSKGTQEVVQNPKVNNLTGESAATVGRTANGETEPVLTKIEAQALKQAGTELAEVKTLVTAEKTLTEGKQPAMNKSSVEQPVQTAARAVSEQVQPGDVKPAAATVPAAGDKNIQASVGTAVDKASGDLTAARPAGGDSAQTVVSKAGAESMVKMPEASTGGSNTTSGDKQVNEAARSITARSAGEPAIPAAVKPSSEQASQLTGKDTQTLANPTTEKSPAAAGTQANVKFGLENLLSSGAEPARPAGEALPGNEKSITQTLSASKPSDLIPGPEKVLAAAIADSDTTIPGTVKHLDLLKPLLELMQIDAGENKSTIGAKLENTLYSEKDLIKGLMLLEDIIRSDNTASKNPVISDLLQKIDGLEKDISGQRILNFASRSSVDSSLNYFYFSFPVQMGDEYRLGQIRINKEVGRRGLKNQDNIRFIVSLDTGSMGLVLFHLNWKRNKDIEVQGVVENQKVCNHLSRNIEVLLQGLNNLGYKTKNLGIKVTENDEELDKLRLTLEETPLNIRPLGIDITV